MSKLKEHLNSRYFEAANALRPNGAQQRVIAYVESYEDVFFWRSVLDEFESDRLHFEVMLPSRTSLEKGKRRVLMNQLGTQLGCCMIACVDADYDFLMQRHSETSRRLLDNPFAFHTYVYAIESFQCYAGGLHEACVMATLNDREPFSLETFMQDFSTIIWPLFVWNVWCYRYGYHHHFSLMDFCSVVALRNISISHPDRALDFVQRQVNRRIAQLQQHFPEGKNSYIPLREELLQLGVKPEHCYMFMQGHKLMEGIVLPLLDPICNQLRREREKEIMNLACHDVQRQNELSSYRNSQLPIEVVLKKITSFKRCEEFQRLRTDLRKFVSQFS